MKGSQVNAQDLSLYSASSLTLSQASGLNVANNLQAASAGDLTLDALKLNLTGSAAFAAGGNLTLAADTSTTGLNLAGSNMTFASQGVSHDLTSITAGGNVSFSAGGDLISQAAQVNAGGLLTAVAGGNIQLQAVTDSQSVNWAVKEGSHGTTVATYAEQVQGSSFSGAGGVGLVAGVTSPTGGIVINASNVTSANGAVTLAASGDVSITSGTQETDSSVQTYSKKSGFLSSSSKSTNDVSDVTGVVASTVSGNTVQVAASGDISVLGSNVASTLGTSLSAGGDITIAAATASDHEEHDLTTKQSGVFGTGGLGVMIGGDKRGQTSTLDDTTAAGSLVGSVNGDLSIVAGDTVHITGSDVLAGGTGSILVQGQDVVIDAAQNTSSQTQTYKQSQSGLTLSLSGGIVSQGEGAVAAVQAADHSSDGRVQALEGISAARDIANVVQGGQTNLAGVENGDVGQATTGIALNIGFGGSSASSASTVNTTTAVGSTLSAGGNLIVEATGSAPGSGALDIVGSALKGDNVVLAGQTISLTSAQDASQTLTDNSSHSGGIGLSLAPTGVSLYANYGASSGNGTATSVTQANTTVTGTNTVVIASTGDTTLAGAQVTANQIVADVGGNLLVQSLQDNAQQNANSSNFGVGFNVPIAGAGSGPPSLNLAGQASSGKGSYDSVTSPTGLFAGDGGYQVNVGGQTTLVGGYLTSSQAAADNNLNSLTTASLDVQQIANTSSYSASTFGGGISLTPTRGGSGINIPPPQSTSGGGSSTTESGVTLNASSPTVTLTGGGTASQAALATLEGASGGLTTDNVQSRVGALSQNPNIAATVQDQQQLQTAIGQANQAVQQTVAQYADAQLAKANSEALQAKEDAADAKVVIADPNASPQAVAQAQQTLQAAQAAMAQADATIASWDPQKGGARFAAEVVGAALVGGAGGGVGSAASAAGGVAMTRAVDPMVQQSSKLLGQAIANATGADPLVVANLLSSVLDNAIGGAVGGGSGASAAGAAGQATAQSAPSGCIAACPTATLTVQQIKNAQIDAAASQDVYAPSSGNLPDQLHVADADEMAKLQLPANLQNVTVDGATLRDDGNGFQARVYVSDATDPPQYIVAFRGTRGPTNTTDVSTDAKQAAGLNSGAYQDAIEVANAFTHSTDGSSVVFTGHSLGGGLASTAALATGYDAVTFNAAGLSANTIGQANAANVSGVTAQIQAFYVNGDPVSTLQDALGLFGLPSPPVAVGQRLILNPVLPTTVTPSSAANPVTLHTSFAIIQNSLAALIPAASAAGGVQ